MEIDRHSIAPEVNLDDNISLDEHDFVPHFQRVSISGEDTSGVPLEDLERASRLLIQALDLRERYMTISYQSFPQTTGRFVRARQEKDAHVVHHDERKSIAGEFRLISWNFFKYNFPLSEHPIHPPQHDPWDYEILDDLNYTIKAEDGTFQVYKDSDCKDKCDYPTPKVSEFIQDMQTMCFMIADGPLKSFCYRRLSYLYSKFQLHVLLNEMRELASQKAVPHRDFYNIRKVDTHIHAASCMNQKHLLRFIKKTLKNNADEVVTVTKSGQKMTLSDVFKSMNLTTYDLTVDMLDVHAVRISFKLIN